VVERWIAASRHARAAPITPNTIPNRASVRHENGAESPAAPGSLAASGTRTRSSCTSHWIDARSDSFVVMSVAVNPGVDVSTRKPRTPSSVRAHTTATSAIDARPIQRLLPSRIQSPPSRRAEVCIDPGSLPPAGSVRAKHPIAVPARIAGSQRSRCSSEPNLSIADIASEPCTDTNVRHDESTASSS
jgi:hypothetical protein